MCNKLQNTGKLQAQYGWHTPRQPGYLHTANSLEPQLCVVGAVGVELGKGPVRCCAVPAAEPIRRLHHISTPRGKYATHMSARVTPAPSQPRYAAPLSPTHEKQRKCLLLIPMPTVSDNARRETSAASTAWL